MPNRILTIVGARPQFVKAAMVSRALSAFGGVEEVLVHTGQHYDDNMSSVFFRELGIREPDVNLQIGSGSHGAQTGQMLVAIERAIVDADPRAVLVYGDTNSTLAGALAAAKLGVPLLHVEAGLRSFNRAMPEEVNRVVADTLASVLYAPTSRAVENLAAEGILAPRVLEVGDVMYDAALSFRERVSPSRYIAAPYVLATIHRAENTDDPSRLSAILDALRTIARSCAVILPLHPRTRARIEGNPALVEGIQILKPVGYLEMLRLERDAAVILTDSGGVQKEAFFQGVPCVTIRRETEWVELVEAGWNRLADPERSDAIVSAYEGALRDALPAKIPLYGDGAAAQRVAGHIAGISR